MKAFLLALVLAAGCAEAATIGPLPTGGVLIHKSQPFIIAQVMPFTLGGGRPNLVNPDYTPQTLADGATVSWDTNQGAVASLTLGGNRTIAAPTNLKRGSYILHLIQDGTGSRTVTWNAVFKFPGGAAPALTTSASARDVCTFISDGTNLYGNCLPDVR